MIRFIFSLPFAAVISAGLFLFMAGIVRHAQYEGIERRVIIDDSGLFEPVIYIYPSESTLLDSIFQPPPPAPENPLDKDCCEKPVLDASAERPPMMVQLAGMGDIPSYSYQGAPTFPAECERRGLSGEVTVIYDITADGQTTNVRIASSTERCFNQASMEAVRSWRFRVGSDKNGSIYKRGETRTFYYRMQP